MYNSNSCTYSCTYVYLLSFADSILHILFSSFSSMQFSTFISLNLPIWQSVLSICYWPQLKILNCTFLLNASSAFSSCG